MPKEDEDGLSNDKLRSETNEKIEEIGLCISENLQEKRSTKMKGMTEEI